MNDDYYQDYLINGRLAKLWVVELRRRAGDDGDLRRHDARKILKALAEQLVADRGQQ